jgi:hypothetical protein
VADDLPELPQALRRVLAEVPDSGLRQRFEQVWLAAARAINHLRDLDLSRYETDTADENQNLDLLEAVAPFLGATVTDVTTLVGSIDESFPKGVSMILGDTVEADKARRAVEVLHIRGHALRRDVLQLGNQLRSPRAVADRWNFLNNLQTARGRLRAGIGEMVADAASVYAEVSRASVIPEYQTDVNNAVGLRRTLHRFAIGLRVQLDKVEQNRVPSLPALLEGLLETMEQFGKTATWRELRAPDKKEFVKFRVQLGTVIDAGSPRPKALEALKGFVSFLELLSQIINQRETLRTHDHACLADLTAQLEQVENLPVAKRRGKPMEKVLVFCERMTGRDHDLDGCTKRLKDAPSGEAAQIQELREHAVRLMQSA